jgi:hypothetical protein
MCIMLSFVMSIEHLKFKYFNAERSAMPGTVGRYIMCTTVRNVSGEGHLTVNFPLPCEKYEQKPKHHGKILWGLFSSQRLGICIVHMSPIIWTSGIL